MALPIVTVEDQTILLGTTTELGNLFSAFDPDSDPLTRIQIRDNNNNTNSGYITFNGAVQPPNTLLTYNYSDLSLLVYHAGTDISVEQLDIRVEANGQWSSFESFRMYTVLDNLTKPVLTVSDLSVVQNEFVRVSESVAFNDPDGYPVMRWRVRDWNPGPSSGRLVLNGVTLAPLDWHYVEVEDFADLRFYAAFSAPNRDVIELRAFDGVDWSNPTTLNGFTTLNNNFPVVVPQEYVMATDERVALANLFSVTDADNNTMKRFRFWDATPHSWSGNLLRNGVALPANTWIEVEAEDLGTMEWESASRSFSEQIRVQAFDGSRWSEIQTVRVATNEKPVIGVADEQSIRQQLEFVDMSDLIVKLDNGPVYTRYEVYDATTDPLSGSFRIGSTKLAAGQVHNLSTQQFFDLDFKSGVYEQRSLDEVYVRAYNGTFWSDWTRHTIRTEPEYTDALVAGSWLNFLPQQGGILNLTYSFMQLYPDYDSGGAPANEFVQPWIEMRQLVRRAFERISEVANIQFEEVPDSVNGEFGRGGLIRIGTYCVEDAPEAAYAFFPADPISSPQGGDMWFNRFYMGGPLAPRQNPCPSSGVPFGAWGEGTSNYAIFMHELGHALGEKHPFSGSPVLPPATNSADFTGMSYTGSTNGRPARGPMIYDISALQTIYGANNSFNNGNNLYDINYFGGSWNIADSIWDTAGQDTLSAADQVVSASIDLRPGSFQSIGLTTNLSIAFGVDIENATGGSGSDSLIGNDLANLLRGNAGNDTLRGYGADDVLNGMAGNDTFVYTVNDGNDTINELAGAGRDNILVQDFLGLNVFTDDLSFSREGNDLVIDFTIDEGISRGSVRIENQAFGKYRVETLDVLGQPVDLKYLFTQITQPGQQFSLTTTMGQYGFLVAPA